MKTYALVAACAVLGVLSGVTQAQQPETTDLFDRLDAAEARIRELEHGRNDGTFAAPIGFESGVYQDGVAEKLAELEASIKDVGKTAKSKVSPGTSASTMRVVGRVHVDYWGFPEGDPGINVIATGDPTTPEQARLNFRRMRFGVRGDVGEQMEYRIEMEFAGGNNSEFRDAWLGWNDVPFLQTVLIGNQKRPYGLDHLNSSRYNVFIERPFVIEAFNEDARRLGICAYGITEDLRYNWRYGVYNLENIQSTGNYVNNALQMQVAARFANTIWYDESSDGRGYAHWALSGTYANPDGDGVPDPSFSPNQGRFRTRPEARTSGNRWLDTGRIAGADDYGLVGAEAVINVGPLQWVAEYQNVWMSRTNDASLDFNGGYTYVSYVLTGEHIPWDRATGCIGRLKPFENFFLVERCRGGCGAGWGAWEVAARWSYADFNDDDIFGGRGEAFTFGMNWYWTPNARMQFNYIFGEIDDRDVDNDPAAPNLQSGDYQIVGTRFMIDF